MSKPRRNMFGEAFCTDAAQLRQEINDKCPILGIGGVYLVESSIDDDNGKWSGEVAENGSGETVCFIETTSRDAVLSIAREIQLEVS